MAEDRRRRRAYGRPTRVTARSTYVMACLRHDAYAAVQQVMKRERLSASGAVHHLVRLAAGLEPLTPS